MGIRSSRTLLADLGVGAALTATYVLAGKLGLMLAIVNPSATAVWPTTGIALAALLALGSRFWPAVWIGAFLVNVTTSGSGAISLGIASGNTLEALVGAYLVRRYCHGQRAFDRPKDVFKFTLLAGVVSTAVSATIGVTSLLLGGLASRASYGQVWLTWWLGDAVGSLIVAPPLLLWWANHRISWNRARALEALLLLVSVLSAGFLVFVLFSKNHPLTFLCTPPLVWAAFRFGPREAATSAVLLSGISIWGTLRALGPFAQSLPNESLLLLQAFMGATAVIALGLAAVVSERERFQKQLVHLAEHDSLTDLPSRRRFQDELALQLAQARRYGGRGTLLYMDLDGFKSVNDCLGHSAGDELLTSLARLLRRRLRDSDLLARLGGDEFAVLLPHTGVESAQALADQLLEAIGQHTLVISGQTVGVTASIGIALFPEHGETVEELLAHADVAMYQAKEGGGNGTFVYVKDGGWEERIRARVRGERALRAALKNGSFLIHAQPIADIRRNRIWQHELLLRLPGEQGDLYLPSAFLATAQRSGLVRGIDRWVVRQAIHLIARQREAGRETGISANISGTALADAELPRVIEREIGAADIPPGSLTLEITEAAVIADVEQTRRFADALKSLGCRLALDDFGVGSSSLYQLKHLPVDYLKIDGSFIRDLARDAVDRHLVKAVVEVARALDMKTIAECVGDAGTIRVLRQCGVDYAQGNYIGEPRAVSEIWPDNRSQIQARA